MKTLFTITFRNIQATFERELVGEEIAFVHILQNSQPIDFQDLPEPTQHQLHDAAIEVLDYETLTSNYP